VDLIKQVKYEDKKTTEWAWNKKGTQSLITELFLLISQPTLVIYFIYTYWNIHTNDVTIL